MAVTLDTSVAVSFIATNALFTTRVFHSIFIQVLGVPAYFLVIEIKYSLIYSPYVAAQSLQLLSDPDLILLLSVGLPF